MKKVFPYCLLQTVSMVVVGICQAQAQEQGAAPVRPEEIVVTGTRLSTSGGFSAPTPVTALGADFFEQQSPGAVLDALNKLPQFANSASTTSFSGYTRGGNSVDLRGLGAVRTLVLMNGRRLAPRTGDGIVDTNVIPASLIERVDVVTGGASAAYGSDAVSGVVNFILKDSLEGVTAQYHYSEDEHGGSEEHAMQFGAGMAFAEGRGHFLFGADGATNKGVGNPYTREWTSHEDGLVVLGANRPAGLPSRILSQNVEYSQLTGGGLILGGPLDGTAFGPGGEPYQLEKGLVGGAAMISPTLSNYGYSSSTRLSPLRAPLDRVSALARATYELTDNLKVWANVGYAQVDVNDIKVVDQPEANLIISIDNPFLPESVRQQMLDNGLTTFRMARVHEDIASALTDTTAKQWTFATGVEGMLGDGWSWDLTVQRGQSRFLSELSDVPRRLNLYAAINAITDPVTGEVVCGPLETNPMIPAARRALVDPGCVPANPFGPDSYSAEARQYITGPNPGQSPLNKYTQDVIEANLRGDLLQLWAGPLSMAAGVGWRRDHTEYTVRNSMPNTPEEGRYYLGNFVEYEGTQRVKEGYVELGLPLVTAQPFADSLGFNGAIRVTDYETSGTVETWKVGLTYELGPVRLRGTKSRDIRAPNLTENFASAVSGIRAGIVNPFTGQSAPTQSQGIPGVGLTPELADTWSAGIVFQPSGGWLGRFSASVDYFDIEITDVIGSPGFQEIVDRCYAGQAAFCDRITFDPLALNGIAVIRSGPINSNRLETKGVDIEASWAVPMPGFIPGQIVLRGLATHTDSWVTTTGVGAIDRIGEVLPEWNWNLNLGYTNGGFSANAIVNGHSKIYYDRTLIGPDDSRYDPSLPNSINKNTFDDINYLTLSARYGFDVRGLGKMDVFGVITNALDKAPPYAAYAIRAKTDNNNVNYDYIGRTYKLGVRFVF